MNRHFNGAREGDDIYVRTRYISEIRESRNFAADDSQLNLRQIDSIGRRCLYGKPIDRAVNKRN